MFIDNQEDFDREVDTFEGLICVLFINRQSPPCLERKQYNVVPQGRLGEVAAGCSAHDRESLHEAFDVGLWGRSSGDLQRYS